MKPLISVIVPVYKAEKFLEECVNSIKNQSYRNIEIILVNDGSPDSSGMLCDTLGATDPRIKVFHKENGGAADARNFGAEKSSGEYIAFVDSDDLIAPDYLDFLFENLNKYRCEVSCCSYFETSNRKNLIDFNNEINKESTTVLSGRDACKKMMSLGGDIILISPCCKIVKNELIKNNPYPVGHACEDEATSFKYYYNSEKVIISNAKLYAYYQNPESVMHRNKDKLYYDSVLALKLRIDYFKEKNDIFLEKLAINSLLSAHISHCIIRDLKSSEELKAFSKEYLFSDKLLLKSKIKLIAFRICPTLYRKFLNSL